MIIRTSQRMLASSSAILVLFLIAAILCARAAYILTGIRVASSTIRTINRVVVFCVFLVCGVTTSKDNLNKPMTYGVCVGFVLVFTFAVYPIIGMVIGRTMHSMQFNQNLVVGFMVACCLPPPTSAGVILTQSVEGNEKLAILCSVVGNLVGVILSPLLVRVFVLNPSHVGPHTAFSSAVVILAIVLLPLMLGYIITNTLETSRWRHPLSVFNKALLAVIIFFTFYEVFEHQEHLSFTTMAVVTLVIIVALTQAIAVILVCFFGNWVLGNSTSLPDMHAIVFSGAFKSLTAGIAVVNSLVADGNAKLISSEIIVPIMLFEVVQVTLVSATLPLLNSFLGKHIQ